MTQLPGGGAAGGLGAGLAGFLDAEIRPGAEFILDLIRFREVARGADLIVTGEGKLDRQTLGGKAPAAVGRAATDLGVPVIAIAGSVDSALTSSPRLLRKGGWSACFSILPRPIPLEESISRAGELLDSLCAQLGSVMRSVRGKS
ncbi:glycerate kinase [Candidatus Sumerlaeota bacterium]|nr:glycerate kinase [Candidatus Sumerlaeota bacterium]